MEVMKTLESIGFAQKRQEVHILCDLLFEYMQTLAVRGEKPLSFNRFVLVRALEEIFHPVLVTVSGYSIFLTMYEVEKDVSGCLLFPHQWLALHSDHRYIIDVLPVDGTFGLSVPQAVVQARSQRRFIPAGSMYPSDWGVSEKQEFSEKVSNLVEVLMVLQQKIPL